MQDRKQHALSRSALKMEKVMKTTTTNNLAIVMDMDI